MQSHPFDSLYDNRPRLIIHSSLKNCASITDLAKLAKLKGYQVVLQDAHMINDVQLNEGFDISAPIKNHSIRSAKRFLDTHPGID